ncbi:hypothetical protein HII31_01866 [Pseudocercospora fuligena]|uniref:Uncharacterized protein n=1 Tax=Pseudocercospora fuligena TaxID=685502 RepID=A0A8H6VLM8_9PEZI|nr:hypothetical protein HII31_01866 [Pseudocercospora fuligena]
MFDSTGIIEIFVSRIDSRERNPRYLPPSPIPDGNGGTYLPAVPTQERFAISVFLTEKFDCMGNDTVKVTFSLSGATACTVRYFHDWQCSCAASDSSEDGELPVKAIASPKHGCYERLERIAHQDALLGPVNGDGWPLEGGEVDEGCIIITLQRGTIQPCAPAPTSKYRFVPATGSAGASTTITFDYRSRYKGLVELLSTTTFSSCNAPSLQMTRAPNGLSVLGKHALEERSQETNSEDSKSKKAKLASGNDGLGSSSMLAQEYHHPLSPFWSEEST